MMTNFSRDDTKAMKGIAIFLMLMHHLWTFPQRLPGGELEYLFRIFGQSSISYIGSFGKICVSLFFFLGGYGLYVSQQRGRFDLIGRIKNLYINYWKVFVIFVPIAFLFFADQPPYCEAEYVYSKFSQFSYQQLIGNFLGVSHSYNSEWWFFQSYIIAIITFPLITKVINRFSVYTNYAWIVILSLLVTNVFPVLSQVELFSSLKGNYLYESIFCQSAPYVASFWTGCLMAKDQTMIRLTRMLAKNRLLSPLHCLFFLGAIVYVRTSVSGPELDILYAPLFTIFSITLLYTLPPVKKIFQHLGSQSTNMWLIHSFYCYYFYEIAKFIVAPRYAILSLILLVALSDISAVILSKFWTYVERVYRRLIAPRIQPPEIST